MKKKNIRKNLGKFEADEPIIGVYGVTSVGKSTFLNTLLGSSEFKVGMGETTKKIHIIQHNANNKKNLFDDVSLEKEYISKDIDMLKNFALVDVPGTNKSFSDNDITNIVSKLDVIIWIFDIHSDISKRDLDFLQNVILQNMVKTVVILNKIDSGIEDIDFDDIHEYNEFVTDVKSRRDHILDFFKENNAIELLVSIVPFSAKKLLSSIKKNKNLKFKEQQKELENILITVAKSAFIQKQIFRDDYDKIKLNVTKEIELNAQKIIEGKGKNLQKKLLKISDIDIINDSVNVVSLFNKDTTFLKVSDNYKTELNKINDNIKGEIQ